MGAMMLDQSYAGAHIDSFPDLKAREWVSLVPLIALMLWLGCYTQTFMPPISSATSHILDQSRMNDEYRVQSAPLRSSQMAEVRNAR